MLGQVPQSLWCQHFVNQSVYSLDLNVLLFKDRIYMFNVYCSFVSIELWAKECCGSAVTSQPLWAREQQAVLQHCI